MDDVTIRPAELGDSQAVFVLLSQFATSYQPTPAMFDNSYPELLRQSQTGNVDLLIAQLDDEVVGYVLVFRLLVLHANGSIAQLQELMVKPGFRGRGIGRKLVQAVVEQARVAGVVEITVPTRRARDYYLRLGFRESATYLKRPLAPHLTE